MPNQSRIAHLAHTRTASVVAHVAELSVFFAAAAALGMGLLGLR